MVENPVLVVQGQEDRLTSPGGSVLLSRALPNATLMLEPHVGHNAHLELGARFVEIVREFLARHDSYTPV
jgi:pimeloyl-ACP methyl ester carboxylesterase